MNRVTITGADDNTPIAELTALSADFPFVEWGILVSRRGEGKQRFPSRDWQTQFARAVDTSPGMTVSMHICGEWVRSLLRGRLDRAELPPETARVAGRFQINTHAEEHYSTVAAFNWMLSFGNLKQFIIQLDGVNDHLLDAAIERGINAVGLTDGSHGAGILPDAWPDPHRHTIYHGYAGGIGPDNVAEQITKMTLATHEARVHRNLDFWIDMEGWVRDENDRLDLAKVRRVVETCAPLVKQMGLPTDTEILDFIEQYFENDKLLAKPRTLTISRPPLTKGALGGIRVAFSTWMKRHSRRTKGSSK